VTYLRCGGIYSDSFITKRLLILTVEESWKPVNIWWNYKVYKKRCHFWALPVHVHYCGWSWFVVIVVLCTALVYAAAADDNKRYVYIQHLKPVNCSTVQLHAYNYATCTEI